MVIYCCGETRLERDKIVNHIHRNCWQYQALGPEVMCPNKVSLLRNLDWGMWVASVMTELLPGPGSPVCYEILMLLSVRPGCSGAHSGEPHSYMSDCHQQLLDPALTALSVPQEHCWWKQNLLKDSSNNTSWKSLDTSTYWAVDLVNENDARK